MAYVYGDNWNWLEICISFGFVSKQNFTNCDYNYKKPLLAELSHFVLTRILAQIYMGYKVMYVYLKFLEL